MIVHRFMGEQECLALLGGKTLVNNTNHKKDKKRTNSFGFCFFKESPDEAVHWLSGIADLDYCVTLEVPDNYLVKTYGLYVDDEASDLSKPMNYREFMAAAKFKKREEYCRRRYSLNDVQILAITDKYYSMYPPRSAHQHLIKAFVQGMRV